MNSELPHGAVGELNGEPLYPWTALGAGDVIEGCMPWWMFDFGPQSIPQEITVAKWNGSIWSDLGGGDANNYKG